jgi:hypothetical protein
MSADGSTPIAGQAATSAAPASVTEIAAELAKLHAALEHYGHIVNMTPAQDEEWQRLFQQMRDLEQVLLRARPRNAREEVVTAALAVDKVSNLDGVGGCLHTEAHALAVSALAKAEAEAGITAEDLGLKRYTLYRDQPVCGEDDEGTRSIMQMAHDAGYLAAVARFAPGFYRYVKAELDRAHGFNPLVHREPFSN